MERVKTCENHYCAVSKAYRHTNTQLRRMGRDLDGLDVFGGEMLALLRTGSCD